MSSVSVVDPVDGLLLVAARKVGRSHVFNEDGRANEKVFRDSPGLAGLVVT